MGPTLTSSIKRGQNTRKGLETSYLSTGSDWRDYMKCLDTELVGFVSNFNVKTETGVSQNIQISRSLVHLIIIIIIIMIIIHSW